MLEYFCNECKDKGFIDTGNNDIPCRCKTGMRTYFNGPYGRESGRDFYNRQGEDIKVTSSFINNNRIVKPMFEAVYFNPSNISFVYVEYGKHLPQHDGYGTPGYAVMVESPSGTIRQVTRPFATDKMAHEWIEENVINNKKET